MSRINTNVLSLQSARMLAINNSLVGASLQKMSTGLAINRGADNPAGLISSEDLRAQLRVLEAETRSLERSDAVANVAEGALSEISDLLVEGEALAVANANTAGMSDAEREANEMVMASISQTVDRLASTANFNGERLLDGTAEIAAGGETFTIASAAAGSIGAVDDNGTTRTLSDIGDISDPTLIAGIFRQAGSDIARMRGEIGAFQKNAIAPTIRSYAVAYENTTAAESIIRDTDFAFESANLSRALTLQGSALAVAAMANNQPASALKLLG